MEHNHTASAAQLEVRRIVNTIKRKAMKTKEQTSSIVADGILNVSTAAAGIAPSVKHLARTVQRARVRANPTPANPKCREDIVFPPKYCRTAKDEHFLLYDSGGPERKLLFGTKKNLDILAACNEWFMDGTFNTVPTLFLQLFTIHGKWEDKILPLVYIFLADKSKESYRAVFGELKRLQPDLNPLRIMTDFEMSSIISCQEVFPQAQMKGCLFHFRQCIVRHIQRSPLQSAFREDAEVVHNVKMLCALAFVPPNKVISAFERLIQSPYYKENEKELSKLIEYFEKTWIGVAKRGKRGRAAAMFDIEMWNHYSSVLDDALRTNNHVEGWHKRLTSRAQMMHSTLWKFLDLIISEQSKTEFDYEQCVAGYKIANKRKKYKDIDTRIKNVVEKYKNRKICEYLSGIAHNTTL